MRHRIPLLVRHVACLSLALGLLGPSAFAQSVVVRPGVGFDDSPLAGAGGDGGARFTVDAETFFDDDPGWLVGLRPGVGLGVGGPFANLGLAVGKVSARHLYVGGLVSGAWMAERPWARLGLRTGLLYRRLFLDLATGTNLGVMFDLNGGSVALVPQLWGEVRLRVSPRHFVTGFAELDLRHRKLGASEDAGVPTIGIGWSVVF